MNKQIIIIIGIAVIITVCCVLIISSMLVLVSGLPLLFWETRYDERPELSDAPKPFTSGYVAHNE